MAFILAVDDYGVTVSAVLTDANGNVVPTPDAPPIWAEDSAGAVLSFVSSDDSSATFARVASGSANVTYTESNADGTVVTGTFPVVCVDEPVAVTLTGAVAVAPDVEPAPEEPAAE